MNHPTPDNPNNDGPGTNPADTDHAAQPDTQTNPTIPPFNHDRFVKDLWIDSALRWLMLGAVAIAAVYLILTDLSNSPAGLVVIMLLAFGWIAINSISATIWRTLPHVTALIGPDPDAAEAQLTELIKRRPLVRWVRLMLYHRLASIRHRQHRYPESAAICQSLLAQTLGPARRQRAALLLMLTEARLHCVQLPEAYTALVQLHTEPLSLVESLQRLTLQTRYEVLAGHDAAALTGVRQKLLLAELMPAEHCGAMHVMMTTAAKRAGNTQLADWLWRRAKLLCSPTQIQQLFAGPFAIGVVAPPDPNS